MKNRVNRAFAAKKKISYLALIALVGIAFSSCSLLGGGGNDPEYRLSDLQTLWHQDGTRNFVRFTTEQSDEPGYLYGREWDETDRDEEDLVPYGNGWFKYKFETTGNLTEIHLMDNGGAEIPKVYIVTKLTDTELAYYEKDHPSSKFTFTKVIVLPGN